MNFKNQGRWLWSTIVFLILLAISFTVFRLMLLANPGAYDEQAANILPSGALEGAKEYNQGFENQPFSTVLHIIPGTLFLIFGAFQFSPKIRARKLAYHRWSGRVLIVLALTTGIFGLYLGIEFRFTGAAANSAVTVFGAFFLFAILRAWFAIRRFDIARHREWMIRAYAIAIGIAVIRIVYMLLFVITRLKPLDLIGASFWIGWRLVICRIRLHSPETK